jgi:prefoldin subunit 5
MPSFAKLEQPHKTVHGMATELASFDVANASDDAIATLCKKLDQVSKASEEVCKDLDSIMTERETELDKHGSGLKVH